MFEDVDPAGIGGLVTVDLRPGGWWPWVVVAIGAVIIGVGGILVTHTIAGPPVAVRSTSQGSE